MFIVSRYELRNTSLGLVGPRLVEFILFFRLDGDRNCRGFGGGVDLESSRWFAVECGVFTQPDVQSGFSVNWRIFNMVTFVHLIRTQRRTPLSRPGDRQWDPTRAFRSVALWVPVGTSIDPLGWIG